MFIDASKAGDKLSSFLRRLSTCEISLLMSIEFIVMRVLSHGFFKADFSPCTTPCTVLKTKPELATCERVKRLGLAH